MFIRVLISECDKGNVNVKLNFATVSVLDMTDIVFTIETSCTE